MDGKAALRAQVRDRRARRGPEERARAAAGLRDVVLASPVVVGARRLACYVSGPAEPGTGPLREALLAGGCEVLLPVVTASGLDWALEDGSFRPGPYGLREPAGPRLGPDAVGACDVVLVPALAVDAGGGRLGQGGGYYDRALAGARLRGPVVAVVHDDEVLGRGQVPVRSHDRRVDAVATPTRWVTVGSGGAASSPPPRPPGRRPG